MPRNYKRETLDAIKHLACINGKVPTEGELADFLGITVTAAGARMQRLKNPDAKRKSPKLKTSDGYYDSHFTYTSWRNEC